MNINLPGRGKKSIIVWPLSLVLLVMLAWTLWRSHSIDLEDVLGNMAKKNEIISQMKTDLFKSVEAEKNAVLADTDEESQIYAQQSVTASAAVDEERKKLRRFIEEGKITRELELLREFDRCWDEFLIIDRTLLDYAVQNTNLKAANLSFTSGKEAIKRFERTLSDLIAAESNTSKGLQIAQFSYEALSSGLEIYSLEGPHIIESRDERMDQIEAQMANAASQVKTALDRIGDVMETGDQSQALLSSAKAAFADFIKINEEVIKLSRQNTNIKSVELSLGAKRKITAQCEEDLNALQDIVKAMSFKATR
jgi:hypothetical protein